METIQQTIKAAMCKKASNKKFILHLETVRTVQPKTKKYPLSIETPEAMPMF